MADENFDDGATAPRAVVHPATRNKTEQELLQIAGVNRENNNQAKSRRRTWFEKQGLQFGDNELELEYLCTVCAHAACRCLLGANRAPLRPRVVAPTKSALDPTTPTSVT